MSDFKPFAAAIAKRFDLLSSGELFVVDLGDTDLFTEYLAAFPEGTNPIFRERTEHDCQCCKQFIRNLGHVVAIRDGQIQTVWGGLSKLREPYATVAAKLSEIVRSKPLKTVFRTEEPKFGSVSNFDKKLERHEWHHFHGTVNARHKCPDVGTVRGAIEATVQVFQRGLNEITPGAIAMVEDLIASNAIYRGEEHKEAVNAFAKLHRAYPRGGTDTEKAVFVWSNYAEKGARFGNTAIGTLAWDLTEDKDLEAAVKSFEKKVAPENYKRPTALITQRMVDDAAKTIAELGLEPALQRRYARRSDISVNNVLWVDGTVRGQMRDGIAALLADAVAPPKADIKGEEIGIDDFLSRVLPQAVTIEMQVENRHLNNFVSLTAPELPDAPQLFKWQNGFAWSYDGEVADSLKQRVAAAGGRVDGVLRFSHTWNYDDDRPNQSLMDLHVFMPGTTAHPDGCHDQYPVGSRVGWNRRNDYTSRGVQDVDYTGAAPKGYVPVENITFPQLELMPEGKYVFKIHNWALRSVTKSGFKAEIEFAGQTYEYEHPAPLARKEWVTLAEVTLRKGVFTIEHKHATTKSSQVKWGVHTETLVAVDTIMHSPNHWDGQGVGNRHTIFVLKDCKNPDATRGIYNEFLRGDLDKHRKVFEILGAKTKCPPADEQLSGLGFSSTRGDTVNVVVKGKRISKAYQIKF